MPTAKEEKNPTLKRERERKFQIFVFDSFSFKFCLTDGGLRVTAKIIQFSPVI